jgi:hypothetical protein
MSFWENSARVCRVCKKKTDLQAVLITGRPIYFAGLNESPALAIRENASQTSKARPGINRVR